MARDEHWSKALHQSSPTDEPGKLVTEQRSVPARRTDSASARAIYFISLDLWVSESECGPLDKERMLWQEKKY